MRVIDFPHKITKWSKELTVRSSKLSNVGPESSNPTRANNGKCLIPPKASSISSFFVVGFVGRVVVLLPLYLHGVVVCGLGVVVLGINLVNDLSTGIPALHPGGGAKPGGVGSNGTSLVTSTSFTTTTGTGTIFSWI
jgi:hypothetical protein